MSMSESGWRWFVGLNVAVAIMFLAHLTEEQLRGALTTQIYFIVAPVLIVLIAGTAYAASRHVVGLGLALAADLWIVIAVGYSHFYPASADYVGAIANDWGGALGLFMAALAAALWVLAAGALGVGAYEMTVVEDTVTGRGMPT